MLPNRQADGWSPRPGLIPRALESTPEPLLLTDQELKQAANVSPAARCSLSALPETRSSFSSSEATGPSSCHLLATSRSTVRPGCLFSSQQMFQFLLRQ